MFHFSLKLRLVDLNYNFECDWLIKLSDNKLSDNKLSDNNLTSELVENSLFYYLFSLCPQISSRDFPQLCGSDT